ncbi:IclR family KDG regulon transcriptional repressor [Pedobacter cryoconitis]|uniref:IclR family KDG regulon transcriptional repressor n=1 Tax=Pedobacter cryoconitis TaxID=188932 RepID=A0A7W9E068_9SPHI|nr:IclR family transcriptional regulator [Pedobacter cryoconitis]MBB5637718.1 IclR family KDG regulon transcriptional repressor [Pedobacter cryoconitis]
MIQSVKRTFDILEYIAKNGNMVRLNDIAQALDLNKTTVHNFLDSLKQLGYLEQDDLSPRYQITPKLQCLYAPDISSAKLKKELRPVLENITAATKESSYLAIQMGAFYRHELKCEPNRAVKISLKMGKPYEMTKTAIGKVFLTYSAYLQANQIKYHGKEHFSGMLQEIKAIEDSGYALDVQQYDQDLNCVAVPLFYQRKIIAVICVSGPSYRFQKPQFAEAIRIINDALKDLSKYTTCLPA